VDRAKEKITSDHYVLVIAQGDVARGSLLPRVCIATWEIEGPSRNAGIGTASTSLADALKRAGYDVTILFLLGCHPTDGNMIDWVDYYRTEKGMKLIPLPMAHEPRIHAAWASSVSYHVYVWLKEHQHEFNIIHFPECQGLAFYSLLAKSQGLAFGDSTFVVSAHGPTFWVKEGSQDYIRNLGELEIDFMERVSVSAADIVVSPSQYLLGWMQQNGWELPERTYVAPYVLPQDLLAENPAPRQRNSKINEIVFFGRLEVRKGLKLFCDALDELCADRAIASLRSRSWEKKPNSMAVRVSVTSATDPRRGPFRGTLSPASIRKRQSSTSKELDGQR
jgi:glycosyltransferase involved in cell wall biosynthesis